MHDEPGRIVAERQAARHAAAPPRPPSDKPRPLPGRVLRGIADPHERPQRRRAILRGDARSVVGDTQ